MYLPGSGGRPGRSTDVYETCTKAKLAWPIDRAVDRLKSPHSPVGAVDRELWPGRPGGRPAREQLLSESGTVDQAVDRRAQRSHF